MASATLCSARHGAAEVMARPRRDADRDREHVVGQKGRRRHQAGDRSQVLAGDDVGAAPLRIGPHGLPIGDRSR